ncbi:MAG: hypothetical protein PHE08_08775, partial [Bacteroidales bacterium]|nr:hypothetical protein [Bacteroidales bacterium]
KKHSEKKSKKTNDVLEMYSKVFKSGLNEGWVYFLNSELSLKKSGLITESELIEICMYDTLYSVPSEEIVTTFTNNKKDIINEVLEEYKNNNSFKNRVKNAKRLSP